MKKIRSAAIAVLFASTIVTARAATFTENFTNNPSQNGWQIFGETDLFQWNSTNQNLEVTWDSTKPNSYFYHPLGTILGKDDTFSLSFDLQLSDAVAFNFGSELTVGLFRFSDATNSSFSRGGGTSPNLFEFDYFPDTGFGDSIDATLKDIQPGFDGFYFAYDNQTLQPGVTYQITLNHEANSDVITGELLTNGVVFTSLPFSFGGSITNFYLDTISISSFAGDGFGDDILAHGTIKNILVNFPAPPVTIVSGGLADGVWQAQFNTRLNWTYTLQRSIDLINWEDVSSVAGTGASESLQDDAPPADKSFYRIKADRP